MAAVLSAQDAPVPGATAPAESGLPSSYRGYSLGMGIDELKKLLAADNAFLFRGDPDVSYLPVTDQNLVESSGSAYIKRVFFQLKEKTVFIMAFTMNTDMIDHYSIFTSFVTKYGQPKILSPKEAVWESETTRISIERPLTVKYIDKRVFDTLVNDSHVAESRAQELRTQFLSEF